MGVNDDDRILNTLRQYNFTLRLARLLSLFEYDMLNARLARLKPVQTDSIICPATVDFGYADLVRAGIGSFTT